MLFSVTDTAPQPMVYSRRQPSGELPPLPTQPGEIRPWIRPRSSRGTAAAATARVAKAMQKVYERFETACDDLDGGLFHLDQPHCYCCMQFFAGAGSSRSHKQGGRPRLVQL
jgi:hypothetical protein